MTDWSTLGPAAVFFGAIFTNNILLTNYLGMCSFLAVSREVKSSLGLGAAVVFVMAMTNALNWPIYYYVLVPLELTYLGYIVYIIVIAASVQLVEMIVERVSESLYQNLGIFLPLITVNCAVFGAVLFMFIRKYTFLASLAYGLGGGLGWSAIKTEQTAFDLYGGGVSASDGSSLSADVALQSNTHGGDSYDGLQIINNTVIIHVTVFQISLDKHLIIHLNRSIVCTLGLLIRFKLTEVFQPEDGIRYFTGPYLIIEAVCGFVILYSLPLHARCICSDSKNHITKFLVPGKIRTNCIVSCLIVVVIWPGAIISGKQR